jgi:hypothetical protein
MRDVSEADWKEFYFQAATTSILADVLDGQSPNLHFGWIALLYRRYRLGDWGMKVPRPEELGDRNYLGWDNECYCLFHRNHDKFGKNIIECAHPYAENVFVFFDYAALEVSFRHLDALQKLPHVPVYHAQPSDRDDFKSGTHLWDQADR